MGAGTGTEIIDRFYLLTCLILPTLLKHPEPSICPRPITAHSELGSLSHISHQLKKKHLRFAHRPGIFSVEISSFKITLTCQVGTKLSSTVSEDRHMDDFEALCMGETIFMAV